MQIVVKRVRVGGAEVGLDPANRQIHPRHLPRRRVRLLTVNRNIVQLTAVRLDEFRRLNKHPARTAARVVHAALERSQDFDQRPNDARRRVKFARPFPLLLRELRQAVLVNATKQVFRFARAADLNVREEVDDVAETPLVELRSREVFRQDALQRVVFPFDFAHRGVDRRADLRRPRRRRNRLPTRDFRNPKDVFRLVLVAVVGEILPEFRVGENLRAPRFETVRNVFQENQPQHDVLVLRRVEIAAQNARRRPNFVLEPDVRRVRFLCLRLFFRRHFALRFRSIFESPPLGTAPRTPKPPVKRYYTANFAPTQGRAAVFSAKRARPGTPDVPTRRVDKKTRR